MDPVPDENVTSDIPQATVAQARRLSLIWMVPAAAALVAAWLAYEAVYREGPTITIEFKTGSGLEAGKTRIRYRNVEVGSVEEVRLTEDYSRVLVKARMARHAQDMLREGTRFWVMRARVAGGEVQGLSTLLSGAYIGIAPARDGEASRHFVGLEKPPVLQVDEPGRMFQLRADRLGSLNIGSPVYFKSIQVGRVLSYELTDTGTVSAEIFVYAPHDKLVKRHSRFWNAGGVEATFGPDGLEVTTESLATILAGGVAFDTPRDLRGDAEAEAGYEFYLHESFRNSRRRVYRYEYHYVSFFRENVRGLMPGAAVEFHGLKVGEVVDVQLVTEKVSPVQVAVLYKIQPERILGEGNAGDLANNLQSFVDAGLRAQLRTANLLTGARSVSLDIFPGADSEATVSSWNSYPVLPAVPTPTEDLLAKLGAIMGKINRMPLEQIGQDLGESAAGLNALINSNELRDSLASLNDVLANVQTDLAPSLQKTFAEAEQTLEAARRMLESDSVTATELRRTLIELGDAARAVQSLADYLGRHPESLLRGKEEGE